MIATGVEPKKITSYCGMMSVQNVMEQGLMMNIDHGSAHKILKEMKKTFNTQADWMFFVEHHFEKLFEVSLAFYDRQNSCQILPESEQARNEFYETARKRHLEVLKSFGLSDCGAI